MKYDTYKELTEKKANKIGSYHYTFTAIPEEKDLHTIVAIRIEDGKIFERSYINDNIKVFEDNYEEQILNKYKEYFIEFVIEEKVSIIKKIINFLKNLFKG